MIYSVDAFPGTRISANGKSYLYFGGTSYLGLQTDEVFKGLFIKNLKKYGTNYGASRNANVQISIFDEAENYMANLLGSEACTTMSSGYLAGQLVAHSLNTEAYESFYAPESHCALHLTPKEPYVNFTDLEQAVRLHLQTKNSVPVVYIDSIDVSGNGYPDFAALRALPWAEVILVVDDSHGVGIVGKNGCGAFKNAEQLNAKELILCCSLGKGFSIPAGAVFGTKSRIEQLTSTNFFGGASPASPAALATLLEGEALFEAKRKLLERNIQLFTGALKNSMLFDFLEGYPVFYFSNAQIAAYLERKHILITNFNYPTKDAPMMSRIVISAAHQKEDILKLARLLNAY